MKLAWQIASSICVVLLLSNSVFAGTQRLVLTGSSTVAPLALEIGKRFEKLNPGVRVDVQTGGSTRGVNDARAGLADIGMASRALKAEESDLSSYRIAMDGIGIILHKNNPVRELSNVQVKAIYTGKITNWQELGGEDRKITAVNKAEGRSTLELFLHYFKLKSRDVRPHVVIGDNQQGIKTVAGNVGAIAYVSIGTAEYEQSHGTPIRLLGMNGISATVDNVRAGHFPLSRPLNLVVKGKPSPLAEKFIQFAQSEAVDDLVRSQYFVPIAR
jgi:phosphate transport system substrate-binding protein